MGKILGLDKVYVLNHIGYQNRREVIEASLKREGVDYELVQNFTPGEFDYENLIAGCHIFPDVEIIHPYGSYRNFSMRITPGSMSLYLKHKWCYEQQILNGYRNIVILEDDAKIPEGFKEYLENNIKDFVELQMDENVEILMLGGNTGWVSAGVREGHVAHYAENQKTRNAHAFALCLSGAEKLVRNMSNINVPIDFKLNEIMQVENMKVAWSEPPIWQYVGTSDWPNTNMSNTGVK